MVSKSLNLPSWQRKQNQLGRMIRSDILNWTKEPMRPTKLNNKSRPIQANSPRK
jgi:hypothetical protein